MPSETNRAIVERFYEELINRENHAVIDELVVPAITIHDPLTGKMTGALALRQLIALFDMAFPGHRVTIHRILVDGEYVTVVHTHHVTHGGEFMGLPPTGRSFDVAGLELLRVVDGQIVEFWRHDDDAGMLRALGLLPAMDAAPDVT